MTEAATVLGVLLLAAAVAWMAARANRTRLPGSQLLRVIASVHVGPRERVVVVEAGEAWLVLGVAPGRVSPIQTLARNAAALPEPQRPFSDWLAKIVEKHGTR